MPLCVRPLKAWRVGTTETGKKKLLITDWSVDHLEKYSSGGWVSVKEPYNSSDGLKSAVTAPMVSKIAMRVIIDYITIPCGHCIECLKRRGQEWTNRCILEFLYSKQSSYFVSLTYRDENLPVSYYSDTETGEAFPAYSLRKADIQKFLKRLRKYFYGSGKGDLRYYIAGEYGPTTMRPHYHLLLFNLPIDDLVPTPVHNYYQSDTLAKLWPYGFHQISPMQPDCIAYTCHYVTGKLNIDDYDFYDSHNMERPFNLQSCKPSLGRRYYEEHPELFDDLLANPNPQIYCSFEDKGYKFSLPSYFWYLYEKGGGKVDIVKDIRKEKANDILDAQLRKTNLNYTAILEVNERHAKSIYSNMLRRDKL